jgi:hemolysin-activating ACP:hemolysin acyltransferase
MDVSREDRAAAAAAGSHKVACRTLSNELTALGLAASFLAGIAEFRDEPLGRILPTLAGQVRRQHYILAFRGERLVGYGGWALCEADIARAWAENRGAPTFEQCLAGDVLTMMTVAAADAAAIAAMWRHVRALYPGRAYVGRRRSAKGARVRGGLVTPPPAGVSA